MIQNESPLDRVIRVLAATSLFLVVYCSESGELFKLFFYFIAVTLLISGFTGYSSIYKKRGISTVEKKRSFRA